jgi:hypothetical protein
MEDVLRPRLQGQRGDCLRDAIRDGRHAEDRTPSPWALGISTARTGGGKYVPEDIRFQILYRLFLRSFSKSPMDCPSAPGAPLFRLTCLYASHTSVLGIWNGLSSGP